MYSVSSNFQVYAAAKNAKWQRKLTIGNSDYSDDVLRWPTISKKWDGVNPQMVTIDLANEGKLFNFLTADPTKMHSAVSLKMGFNYPNLCKHSEEWTNATWLPGACVVTSVSGGFKITKTSSSTATLRADVYSSSAALANRMFNWRATLWVDSAAVNSGWANMYLYDGPVAHVFLKQVLPLPTTPTEYRLTGTFSTDTANPNLVMRVDPAGTCSGWGFYGNFAMCEEGAGDSPYNVTSNVAPSSEFLTLFSGTIDSARYSGGACKLTLIDKFRKLADRKIGDSTSPVAYTASSYLVHDMGWYACTSHGGLSAIASTSNPDIDYQSWSSWSAVFSTDNVRVKAQLTGQTPLEVLRKLSLLTQSAIYVENDKIKFGRFTLAGSGYITLDNSKVVDAEATLDDRQLVNKQYVSAAYDTTSRSFGITVMDTATYSVNSYGLRENLIAESFIWLPDSVSALNLAQRMIVTGRDIQSRYAVKAPLHSVLSTIGDAVLFQDTLLEVSDTYRVMEEEVDMDSGLKTFRIDQTQYFGSFRLDVSALDSSDVLI